MEHYESRNSARPVAEGLHLPKAALEAGLGAGEKSGDGKDTKDSKEKSKKKKTGRLPLSTGIVSAPPANETGRDKPASEAVSTWQKLVGGEAASGSDAVSQAEQPEAKPGQRQAEDATLLEGSGEIALQPTAEAGQDDVPDNVLQFPMDRVRQPGAEAEPLSQNPEQSNHEQSQELHLPMAAGAEYMMKAEHAPPPDSPPPDMPPPIAAMMRPPLEWGEAPVRPLAGSESLPAEPAEAAAGEMVAEPAGPERPDGPDGPGADGPGGSGPGGPERPEQAAWMTTAAMTAPNSAPTAALSGYERTPADVSRAATRGFFLGWVVGRWGKHRAVRRAVAAVESRFKKAAAATRVPAASRQPAAEQVTAAAPEAPPVMTEQPRMVASSESVRERTTPKAAWLRHETVSDRVPAAEHLATQPLTELLAVPAAVVALGMSAEKTASGRAERLAPVPGARSEAVMTKAEVIELAATIKVDGVPLREIYAAKQIDEEGLRAVVETYLRGGDVSRQLQREVIEKQKQFERDPFNRRRSRGQLRDTLQQTAGRAGQKTVELAKLTQQAAGKAGKSLAGGARQLQQKAAEGSDGQQWLGIGAVVVIWAVILMLVLG